MPGLVPGIHVFAFICRKSVDGRESPADGRDKPGHDGRKRSNIVWLKRAYPRRRALTAMFISTR